MRKPPIDCIFLNHGKYSGNQKKQFAYLKKKRKIKVRDAVIYKELLAYVVIYIWTVNSKQLRFGRIPKNLHDFYFFRFLFLMISD